MCSRSLTGVGDVRRLSLQVSSTTDTWRHSRLLTGHDDVALDVDCRRRGHVLRLRRLSDSACRNAAVAPTTGSLYGEARDVAAYFHHAPGVQRGTDTAPRARRTRGHRLSRRTTPDRRRVGRFGRWHGWPRGRAFSLWCR